ncbi:MAG: VTC domain-containing protein [Coriobacteriales bacterium]|jgi:hypothetical protein
MASYIGTFRRKEVKYRLSAEQVEHLMEAMAGHMEADEYGISDINSIYLDTAAHSIIARSMDKPLYKEKLRLCSYGTLGTSEQVFLELKKKFKGIVYKRRVGMSRGAAMAFLAGMPYEEACELNPLPGQDPHSGQGMLSRTSIQIAREIDAFIKRNEPMHRSMLIRCHRLAFRAAEADESGVQDDVIDRELRITFDFNITFEQYAPMHGEQEPGSARIVESTRVRGPEELLEPGESIVEIKAVGAYPLWLVRALDECDAYPTSFSKYGEAYKRCHGAAEESEAIAE